MTLIKRKPLLFGIMLVLSFLMVSGIAFAVMGKSAPAVQKDTVIMGSGASCCDAKTMAAMDATQCPMAAAKADCPNTPSCCCKEETGTQATANETSTTNVAAAQ